ncbi:MAG: winged helix-turn-helix transcriptional regulator [Alphaproteobacteria bacterium]|nr:winged helix-turn-helix transcriptional regulator [Alphaproteobacteria bacterium]
MSAAASGPAAEPQLGVVAPLGQIVLAYETEFSLGGLRVCPSKRAVIAGGNRELLQPRIMQVLVALARRRGEVVSHDELIASCWDGYAVSDDAIHRCIARLRRLSEARGGFTLETVPRVGYQLTESVSAAGGGSSTGEAGDALPWECFPQ